MAKRKIKQPAYTAVDKSSEKIGAIADKLEISIRRMIADGFTPEDAVELSWTRLKVNSRLSESISSAIVQAVTIGGLNISVSVSAQKQYFLSKTWPDARMNLSDQIWKTGQDTKAQMTEVIRQQLRKNRAWNAAAKRIDDTLLPTADLSKKITELEKIARKQLGAIDSKEYKKSLNAAQRHIDRLAQNGAPTERLKKAYQNVITATEKGTTKAIDKALTRAINAKMRYNAERVARTEIARAYGAARSQDFIQDDDVVGYRSVLSSRHSIDDICDFYAEADLYGMGPGVFPKDEGPPYPYHSFCLCNLMPVYRGDSGTFNPKGAEKYIRDNPDMRKPLLGKTGAEAFVKSPENWSKNLRNYKGMEDKQALIGI